MFRQAVEMRSSGCREWLRQQEVPRLRQPESPHLLDYPQSSGFTIRASPSTRYWLQNLRFFHYARRMLSARMMPDDGGWMELMNNLPTKFAVAIAILSLALSGWAFIETRPSALEKREQLQQLRLIKAEAVVLCTWVTVFVDDDDDESDPFPYYSDPLYTAFHQQVGAAAMAELRADLRRALAIGLSEDLIGAADDDLEFFGNLMLFLAFKPQLGQFPAPPYPHPPPPSHAGPVPPSGWHPPRGAQAGMMVGPDWADEFLRMLTRLVARIDATGKVNDVLPNRHEECAEAGSG